MAMHTSVRNTGLYWPGGGRAAVPKTTSAPNAPEVPKMHRVPKVLKMCQNHHKTVEDVGRRWKTGLEDVHPSHAKPWKTGN